MARVMLSALHTFLAATLALGGTVLLVQTMLAVTWETGFYGPMSQFTTVMLLSSVVMIATAVVQSVSGFSYALGHRWGAWGLLLVSVFLIAGTPAPLSWVLAFAAAVIVLDLWASRPRSPDEDEDPDDDFQG